MTTVNMHEAKTRLSQLVSKVEAGEEVVISRDGTPVAKIVPIESSKPPVKFGDMKGQIWISPDFDDPDPEFEDLVNNGPIDPPQSSENGS
jgi:prevent-host-death family protein